MCFYISDADNLYERPTLSLYFSVKRKLDTKKITIWDFIKIYKDVIKNNIM